MRGFGALNSSPPEYLLPSQWVPVLAPTYLLPRRSEWCSHCTKVWHKTCPICHATSRPARRSSLRHRNRAEITVLVCEQKTYPVWLSWRRKSNPVWCELVCYTAVFRVVTQRSSPLGRSVAWRHWKRLCSRLGVNMNLGKILQTKNLPFTSCICLQSND